MQNIMLVKSNTAEEYEKIRYNNLMMRYMNNYSESQTILARMNLGNSLP